MITTISRKISLRSKIVATIALCVSTQFSFGIGLTEAAADVSSASSVVSARSTDFTAGVAKVLTSVYADLKIARVDVPKRQPNASQAVQNKIAKLRAAIILARKYLSIDLQNLKSLSSSRPAGNVNYPGITNANVGILIGLYNSVAPSYVTGSKAKSGWTKFASKLAVFSEI